MRDRLAGADRREPQPMEKSREKQLHRDLTQMPSFLGGSADRHGLTQGDMLRDVGLVIIWLRKSLRSP